MGEGVDGRGWWTSVGVSLLWTWCITLAAVYELVALSAVYVLLSYVVEKSEVSWVGGGVTVLMIGRVI